MTTAVSSAALVTIQPVSTDTERVALAGFLAGYRGLTREAYALDLRQGTSWCVSSGPAGAGISTPAAGAGEVPIRRRPGILVAWASRLSVTASAQNSGTP